MTLPIFFGMGMGIGEGGASGSQRVEDRAGMGGASTNTSSWKVTLECDEEPWELHMDTVIE